MNLFDWFLIAVLACSTIFAFVRGLLLEFFALGGLIAGILLASWNYHSFAPLLSRLITNPSIADVVAFLFIAIGVMILCTIAGKVLNRTADAIGLCFFNRLLGAVFGFARGGLICVAIMMAAAAFLPPSPWITNSRLAPYFLAGAHAVSFVVPHDLQQLILDGAKELKHNAPDWIKLHN